jgi:uncharacterized protein
MQVTIARRQKQRAAHLRSVADAVPDLRHKLGPVTVAVFGSVARGDFNRWSDVDVLVIADALPSNALTRASLLLDAMAPGVEPRGYSRREFELLRSAHDRQLLAVLSDAVTIVDDLAILGDTRWAGGKVEAAVSESVAEQ